MMYIPDLRISLHYKFRNMRVIDKIMLSRTEPLLMAFPSIGMEQIGLMLFVGQSVNR